MIFWEKIVKNALLGTERMSFQEEILPEQLRAILSKEDRADPDYFFLKVLTLASIYKKSGQQPSVTADLEMNLAPVETRAYCSAFAFQLWLKINTYYPKHPYLLELFLLRFRERNWLIPPDAIVDLFNIGGSKNGLLYLDLIANCTGNRGKWLLQFNPKWKFMEEIDNELIFQTGKIAERIVALKRIRRDNPDLGRDLLSATWTKELLKDQKSLLDALAVQFNDRDQEFAKAAKVQIAYQEAEPILSPFQSAAQIEQNIVSAKSILNRVEWKYLPLNFAWSRTFSVFMLQEVYISYQYAFFKRGSSLLVWAAHLHPSVELEKIPMPLDTHDRKVSWSEYCKGLEPILECRRAIELI
ncbi:MAG: DUF5691 domain-containing protein [Saprospiraceae bacterium]